MTRGRVTIIVSNIAQGFFDGRGLLEDTGQSPW